MKKVLVTGENGYIGTKFKEWIQSSNNEIELKYISVRGESWREIDFNGYDAILHLAGIAHVSRNPKLKETYYQINRDLTINLAEKAKRENVKQFIFMSSIIVYGLQSYISENTVPQPADFYGDSKLQAEIGLNKLRDQRFKISIIRPPMVYGLDSKGNFSLLLRIAKKTPLFPIVENKRSVIFIDHLCHFLMLNIKNEESGIFFPQESSYFSTSDFVEKVSRSEYRKVYMFKLSQNVMKVLVKIMPILNKPFSDLYYKKSMSTYKEKYILFNLDETIEKSK